MSQTKAQLLDNIKDNVQLDAQKALRFADSDSSNYVAFRAPGTVSSNVTWTLPAADGSANYVLATDGSGTLSWIADPAGQWVTSGSNVYYTAGNVGIGDSSPSNPLSVTGASAFNGDVQFTGANYGIVWDKSDNAFEFDDNTKATFGTGSDLSVYHSGSHSFIKDSGTGNLQVWTNQLSLLNSGGTESMIQAIENGEVQLYFDNSEKLNTDTDGVNIAGTLHFADDANTYFGRAAADTLIITTAGSERLRVDASGNAGIGTNSPSQLLNLSATNPWLEITGTAASSGDTGIFINANANHWIVKADNYTSANQFQIKNGDTSSSTARLAIDSTGRITTGKAGVGTSNDASEWFKVQSNDSAANISIVGSNDTHSSLNLGDEDDFNIQKIKSDHTNNSLQFFTNNTERLRINSDGRLLINNTASNTMWGYGQGNLQLTGDYQGASASFIIDEANSNSHAITLAKIRGSSSVQSGDTCGSIAWNGYDGSNYQAAARIMGVVDGTPGSGDMPGRLVFGTTPDGGTTPSERLRIDSTGQLLVGTTTEGQATYGDALTIERANVGMSLRCTATDQSTHIYFADGTTTTQNYAGYVQYDHSSDRMAFGAAAAKRMSISADGLLFGTDTAAANALDDYEEGTFDGKFITNSGTFPTQTVVGHYVKIGKRVDIHCQITFSGSAGSGTGLSWIELPFTVCTARGGMAIGLVSGVTWSDQHQLFLIPEINSQACYLVETEPDAPGHAHLTPAAFTNNASQLFSYGGSYIAT